MSLDCSIGALDKALLYANELIVQTQRLDQHHPAESRISERICSTDSTRVHDYFRSLHLYGTIVSPRSRK
jgi:hypothetical protein